MKQGGYTMKSRKWGIPAALTAAVLMFSGSALAQEDEGGPMTQGEDAVYISIAHVKFAPGGRERAFEIINEYFAPAGEAAGTSPPMLAVHYQTGKWDAAWIWVMEGGMADLEWYRSADDIAWYAALTELMGGEEETEALMEEWTSLIADGVTEVGHYHTGEDAE